LLEEAKSAVSDMLGVSDQDVREDPIISCAPKAPNKLQQKGKYEYNYFWLLVFPGNLPENPQS